MNKQKKYWITEEKPNTSAICFVAVCNITKDKNFSVR